jgi:hypothetical protein
VSAGFGANPFGTRVCGRSAVSVRSTRPKHCLRERPCISSRNRSVSATRYFEIGSNQSTRFMRAAVLLLIALSLTACFPGEWGEVESVAPTLNPSPKVFYDIKVTVVDAPGEFTSATGTMGFSVDTETYSCMPMKAIAGVPAVRDSIDVPFEVKKTSPTTFEGRIVYDQFIPKDDYGLGVCRWVPTGASVNLYNGINRHVGSISPGYKQQSRMAFKKEFFRHRKPEEYKNTSMSGLNPDRYYETYNKELSSDQYFFVVTEAKEHKP